MYIERSIVCKYCLYKYSSFDKNNNKIRFYIDGITNNIVAFITLPDNNIIVSNDIFDCYINNRHCIVEKTISNNIHFYTIEKN
jgi:hypothetical protein